MVANAILLKKVCTLFILMQIICMVKLMINSVFGKIMENLRKSVELKYVSRPSFVSQKIFSKRFC